MYRKCKIFETLWIWILQSINFLLFQSFWNTEAKEVFCLIRGNFRLVGGPVCPIKKAAFPATSDLELVHSRDFSEYEIFWFIAVQWCIWLLFSVKIECTAVQRCIGSAFSLWPEMRQLNFHRCKFYVQKRHKLVPKNSPISSEVDCLISRVIFARTGFTTEQIMLKKWAALRCNGGLEHTLFLVNGAMTH